MDSKIDEEEVHNALLTEAIGYFQDLDGVVGALSARCKLPGSIVSLLDMWAVKKVEKCVTKSKIIGMYNRDWICQMPFKPVDGIHGSWGSGDAPSNFGRH
jgi:hypothetical protein